MTFYNSERLQLF